VKPETEETRSIEKNCSNLVWKSQTIGSFFHCQLKNMEPTRPLTPKTPTRAGTSRGAKVIDAVTQEFSSAFDAYTLDAYRELFAVSSHPPSTSTSTFQSICSY
jgi:hypothetical protein